MREYGLKFTEISKYAQIMVEDLRAHMNKSILSVSELASKESKKVILVKEMDISRLMMYAEKLRKRRFVKGKKSLRGIEWIVGTTLTNGAIVKYSKMDKGKIDKDPLTFLLPKRTKGWLPRPKVPISKYGRPHKGECLTGSNVCFTCGKPNHLDKNYKSGGIMFQDQKGPVQGA